MTGEINNLKWEDYMNDPHMSERVQPPIHSIMEYQVCLCHVAWFVVPTLQLIYSTAIPGATCKWLAVCVKKCTHNPP